MFRIHLNLQGKWPVLPNVLLQFAPILFSFNVETHSLLFSDDTSQWRTRVRCRRGRGRLDDDATGRREAVVLINRVALARLRRNGARLQDMVALMSSRLVEECWYSRQPIISSPLIASTSAFSALLLNPVLLPHTHHPLTISSLVISRHSVRSSRTSPLSAYCSY